MIHSRIDALVNLSIRTEGFNLLSIKDRLELSFVGDRLDSGNICSLKLREVLRGQLLIRHIIVLVSLAQSVKDIKIVELLLDRRSIGLSHVLHAAMIIHSRLRVLTPKIGIFLSKYII
jgi:hypothetical protein